MNPQILKEPFHHVDVFAIVGDELKEGDLESLKVRVTGRVAVIIGLDEKSLPKRVKTWIHQLCLRQTAPSAAMKKFEGKLAEPIDLISLPGRIRYISR